MGFVEVDFNVLGNTVGSANNCVATLECQMNFANGEINNLRGVWNGQDALSYYSKWEESFGGESSYAKVKYAIESYARYVDYCKAQYINAKKNAYMRANSI